MKMYVTIPIQDLEERINLLDENFKEIEEDRMKGKDNYLIKLEYTGNLKKNEVIKYLDNKGINYEKDYEVKSYEK